MRRSLVLVALAAVGLSPAPPMAHEARASSLEPTRGQVPSQGNRYGAQGGGHLVASIRLARGSSSVARAASAVVRRWGGRQVREGQVPPPLSGAMCPPDMANIDSRFCIDRWEASLVETTPDGREVPWPPFGPIDEERALRAVSVPNVYPQAYISGAQAARACAASGKRLCAPVEWRRACVGPGDYKFGYGDARIPGRCNDSGTSPMLRLYPQVARSWKLVGMVEMNDPRLNQLEGTLARTGTHADCTNGYGVYDMVGNVHEWTDDPNGTFQGGYYLDTHINGDGCTYRTVAHGFTYHDYSTGFRCCADTTVP